MTVIHKFYDFGREDAAQWKICFPEEYADEVLNPHSYNEYLAGYAMGRQTRESKLYGLASGTLTTFPVFEWEYDSHENAPGLAESQPSI